MDYNHITNFLNKFKKILFQKEELKNTIIKIISEEIKYQIDKDKIRFINGVVFVEGSPAVRNEVMMKKEKILLRIKKLFPQINFLDIK